MKILAIDTTTKFLSLGIYDNGKVSEYNLETGRKLSSLLGLTIKRVLDILGWRSKDIDYFACGLGPGSFTGMRIGIAAIKGLSWAADKPAIGVSTLDILAGSVKDTGASIVPLIDARRGLVYSSVYKKKNGRLIRLKPYMLLTKDEFFAKVKSNAVLLGDGLDLYRQEILKNIEGAVILDKDYWYPRAHSLIALALERLREKKLKTSCGLKPIYLYPKECQIKESKKL